MFSTRKKTELEEKTQCVSLCEQRIQRWSKFSKLFHEQTNIYINTVKAIRDYLKSCKYNPLILNDLNCATEMVNQSIFLSNDEFFNIARELISKFSLSNDFKQCLEGVLLKQINQWQNLLDSPDASTKLQMMPKFAEIFSLLIGGYQLMKGNNLAGFSLLLAASVAYKVGATLSDKVAITLFSMDGYNDKKEDSHSTLKYNK